MGHSDVLRCYLGSETCWTPLSVSAKALTDEHRHHELVPHGVMGTTRRLKAAVSVSGFPVLNTPKVYSSGSPEFVTLLLLDLSPYRL